MSESAFNDAMGAIVTFGVLSVAMGSGGFSLTTSAFEFLKQAVIGLLAGALLGYLAALLIAHERWAFLKEYAPVVSLVAVLAAYFAADGLQASGFMAVFVFGIFIGNKDRLVSAWALPNRNVLMNLSRRRPSSCAYLFLFCSARRSISGL